MRSRCRRSRFTSRTSTRANHFVTSRSPQRVVSVRSAVSAHKATTWDWTQPLRMWKLRLAMASRKKGEDDNGNGSSGHHQTYVSMARGLAEVVAEHGLSELI